MPKKCGWHGTVSVRNMGLPRWGETKKCKQSYLITSHRWFMVDKFRIFYYCKSFGLVVIFAKSNVEFICRIHDTTKEEFVIEVVPLIFEDLEPCRQCNMHIQQFKLHLIDKCIQLVMTIENVFHLRLNNLCSSLFLLLLL